MAGQLDSSYKLYQASDPAMLLLLLDMLTKYNQDEQAPVSLSIQKVFERMVHWITKDLGFRTVYLLLDGVDGFPELASSPGFAAESLTQLFAKAPEWNTSHIFLKGFLPQEIRIHLRERLEKQWSAFSQIDLKWDSAMLAEMLHRRVYAATEGEFASLSAVSALPSGQDLELELARCQPTPTRSVDIDQASPV